MDKGEAKSILEQELERYRSRSYGELLSLVDQVVTSERVSPSGSTYQVETQVFFDNESERSLRVMSSIGDGGWRAWIPLCDDFIIRPDGSFVGE